ncbi:XrtN system VIT domain-containing protein [Mucilaginibacter sp. Bleaf8]|uniref:XrtN system VIT domain-containing protein n=1 Tax=Mucilaginibacter sp. Bleaf8 TaxID=2834430 RepID=UPI001BCF797E|nr:XrtN system VIT domain-containing protein [Mucilaginibacter sp. Bleaf8]MBS7563216.1 XrtN system VIT domain-containing protein [Mucilaginibacter sp. Bleaf8]
MNTFVKTLFQDKLTRWGLVLTSLSAIVFCVSLNTATRVSTGIFFLNYLFSITYLVTLFIDTVWYSGWRLSKAKLSHTAILLMLWFISAFALNRQMNVFNDSADWLCVWIVISSVTFLLAAFSAAMPKYLQNMVYFFLGAACLLFVYYAIYLVPLYALSVVAIIGLGISLHTFIPAFLAVLSIILLIRVGREDRAVLCLFGAGFTAPLIALMVFLIMWNKSNQKIDLLMNQATLNDGKLPAWVAVSQGVEKTAINERILKAGLVYQEANPQGDFFFAGLPSQSFDERKVHDPLVVIASLLFSEPNLDRKARINILKSMYDARHHAQDRLWTGDHLQTSSVVSNVKLYPQYRMAYTEKSLTVHNIAEGAWNQEEAIYTFHMPEGSVVSSLSLWINGHEEKSRLTTQAKADSAYKTVVGVEVHDPSVVHWQEGNTVTVRVFPCTPQENRLFRIGITSPLRYQNGSLFYENSYFDGPTAKNAVETLQISYDGNKPGGIKLPEGAKQVNLGVYQLNRDFKPYWELSCFAPQLATTGFTFADTTYQLKAYQPHATQFNPQSVYLDLNASWSKQEYLTLLNLLKGKRVYAYSGSLVGIDNNNAQDVYEIATAQNFSLFPVFEIAHPEDALLITKNNGASPGLQDLNDSEFSKSLTHYLKEPKQIRIFNLGTETTPYLKALKELRVLNYEQGTITDLTTRLKSQQFAGVQENDSTVVIEHAGLMIQQTKNKKTGNTAPDHLMRLFTYNDIMKKAGADYFNKNLIRPELIAEAERGYIVSPVSSMIVLESQKDYERFGIDENKNSLKNASMKSSGAVPEPKEWMLIILTALVIAYSMFKPAIRNYAA